jgi:hypothetical protein
MMNDRAAWSVSELAERGGYVIHEETGTVGRAKRMWSGDDGDAWVSPVNGQSVKAPVLELQTGDAFVLKDADTFTPLTAKEVEVFEGLQQMVTHATTIAGGLAAASGVPLEQFARLGAAVLRAQQLALERAVLGVVMAQLDVPLSPEAEAALQAGMESARRGEVAPLVLPEAK